MVCNTLYRAVCSTTKVVTYNFTGNFTYIRAFVEFDSTDTAGNGSVSKVLYNF